MINFNKNNMDSRSEFANKVCALIYQKYNGDLEKCLKNIEPLYEDFFKHVRNIYQFVDSQIPLFFLYELKKHGPDNFDMNDQEHEKAIEITEKACSFFYKPNMGDLTDLVRQFKNIDYE